MSKLQHHLQKETENFRMTDAEKALMRARLVSAMETPRMPTQSPYQWFFAPRALTIMAAALLVVISSGTAYAAQGSLPGGVLYPVKVSVLEPMAVALARSPAAKAEANATIAATRVEEAQTLAAQGTLTAETAKEISYNYQVHAQAALALAHDVDVDADADDMAGEDSQSAGATPSDDAPAPTTLAAATNPASDDASTTPAAPTLAVHATLAPVALSITSTSTAHLQKSAPTKAMLSATSTMRSKVESQNGTAATSTKATLSATLRAKLFEQTKILQGLGVEVEVQEDNHNRDK